MIVNLVLLEQEGAAVTQYRVRCDDEDQARHIVCRWLGSCPEDMTRDYNSYDVSGKAIELKHIETRPTEQNWTFKIDVKTDFGMKVSEDWLIRHILSQMPCNNMIDLSIYRNEVKEESGQWAHFVRDRNPVDQGVYFKKMLDMGVDIATLARNCDTDEATIKMGLKLEALPPDVQDAVRMGMYGPTDAIIAHQGKKKN